MESAETTFPKWLKDLLILTASTKRSPSTRDRATRSDPAKSTIYSVERDTVPLGRLRTRRT